MQSPLQERKTATSQLKSVVSLFGLVAAGSLVACGPSGAQLAPARPVGAAKHGVTPGLSLALTVLGPNGEQVTDFRWIAEEDRTYEVVPGVKDPKTLAVRFHASYMPVAAAGDAAHPPPELDPTKPYFISVLPASASSLSPANNPSAFAVGALDSALQLQPTSSRGPDACGGAV